jgi:hypothetical protein
MPLKGGGSSVSSLTPPKLTKHPHLSSGQVPSRRTFSASKDQQAVRSRTGQPHSGQQEYKLQTGDTLWNLSREKFQTGKRWKDFRKADGHSFSAKEARQIKVGTPVYFSAEKATVPKSFTVSSRSGDSLWKIAENNLGDGSRWHELQKGDGRRFTAQEARHIRVGTSVYLTNAKPTSSATSVGDNYPGDGRHKKTQMRLSHSQTDSRQGNQLPGVFNGTAVGVSVASRESSRLHPSTLSPSSSPLPKTWAERERLLGRVDKPTRNPAREAAKGKITDTFWKDHLERRPDVAKVVSQPTWRDPHTGKQMKFPDAKSRRPDFLVRQRSGTNHALEIKATPAAAESSSAAKQRARDRVALQRGAVLGKGKGPHVKVSHATIKTGLPILGPGGNTALPGETQKHVIIKPRSEPTVTKPNRLRVPSAARGLSESTARGVTKGVLRGASRAAMPVAAAIDAYDLTRTYQNGGNTPEFRKKAAGVAGGWGTAAAGAAIGTAIIPIPVVGTVIGAVGGYLVGSGAASKLEEGVEKVAPKVRDGAKKAWNGAKSALHGIFG